MVVRKEHTRNVDYLYDFIKGNLELKTPEGDGEKNILHAIKRSRGQSVNILIDVSKVTTLATAITRFKKIDFENRYNWVELVIIRNNDDFVVFEIQ